MTLASSFRNPISVRSDRPLSDDEIMRVAPSIFAEGKHSSRSDARPEKSIIKCATSCAID